MPNRRTALVAGLLYLVTFAASFPAVLLLAPVLNDPAFVLGAGPAPVVVAGALLDLVNAAACVGTAVVLFPVLRRHGEARALGFVTSRVLEAAIIVTGVVCLLAVLTLRLDGTGSPELRVVTAHALVAVRDWTFLLGPGLMPAVNAALLGSLLLRARLVPRLIPVLGLIGAPLQLASVAGSLFGINGQVSVLSAVAVVPIFLWELFLGLWLTVRGFTGTRPSVRTDEPVGANA
ncbi:MAG: DUF4386 domain-containing protein [Actinobacteria bacterium]|nr:DUF4386 domain-containing protein [Actinomycetota bacterium]